MNLRLSTLLLSLAVGGLMAQTPPPDPQTQPAAPSSTQADKGTQADKKAASTSAPAEVKTQAYKGVLVDMSCASSTSTTASANTPPASDTAVTPPAKTGKTDSANRSTDTGSNCAVSANSKDLGLKMDDGKTVRFDLVGNQRAQDELKNNKHWSKDVSANKPIRAKVYGAMSGDKLIVSSIQ